jgi:hypothetical protein
MKGCQDMYNPELIKQQNDLITLAEQAGARFRRVHNEWRSPCPLHGGDNSSGFAVYEKNGEQRWVCFTKDCGQGDLISFVEKWQGLDFNAACEWLGGDKQIDGEKIKQIKADRLAREIKRTEEEIKQKQALLAELRSAETWIRYHAALEQNRQAQSLWEAQGIPIDYQNYWQLGYCENFSMLTDGGRWTSPTLTIPIFSGADWDLLNIRHKILNPYKPNEKYRPERPGLGSTPFFAIPDVMFDNERIIVVEGEKKAMVTWLTLGSNKVQVIGIPGKTQWKKIAHQLDGQSVYIWLDPDADQDAAEFGKLVKGRVVNSSMKIDDAIMAGYLDKRGLASMFRAARQYT